MKLAISKAELIIILGSLTALAPLSIDMYLPAFTSLERLFTTDTGHVQLTLSSFFVAFSAGQLIYGPLADRYGRKVVLYAGLSIYVVTSLWCTFATTINELIILRFFQALGASASVVIARAVVSDLYTARDAAGIYSAMMLVMGAAPMLAPLMGGYLMEWFGLDAIFEALALFGGLALLLVHYRLQESHGADPQIPLTPHTILSRYLSLLKNRHFIGYTLAGGLSMASLFAYIASSPFILIDHFGIEVENFGWFFSTNAMGFILFGQLNGWALKYKTPLQIISVAIIVQLTISLILMLQSWMSGELFSVLVPLFFQIGLLGFLVPNMTALGMAHFKANAGVASALMGSTQFLIAGIVSMIVSAIHSNAPETLAVTMLACTVGAFLIFQFMCHHVASRETLIPTTKNSV
ncbi:MAG: multidrug effflux MFS transporter [Candidatus Thiodiazotropha sp.]|jgi:MFS transporter, DHA1 family, multidrug resistance protein